MKKYSRERDSHLFCYSSVPNEPSDGYVEMHTNTSTEPTTSHQAATPLSWYVYEKGPRSPFNRDFVDQRLDEPRHHCFEADVGGHKQECSQTKVTVQRRRVKEGTREGLLLHWWGVDGVRLDEGAW